MIELIAAGSIMLGGGWSAALVQDGPSGAPRVTMSARAEIETELRRPPAGEVFRAIERYYPDEYRRLVDALHGHAAAHPGEAETLARLRTSLLRSFYKGRADSLANAPAPMLHAINEQQLVLARLLAGDNAALCAEFATTLFIGKTELPAWYQDRATKLATLLVEAAKQGEGQPPDPKRKALAADDAAIWYEQLLRAEPSSNVRTAVDKDETSGTPEMQCRAGMATYATIDKLPPEQAANVGAYFLTQFLGDLEIDQPTGR